MQRSEARQGCLAGQGFWEVLVCNARLGCVGKLWDLSEVGCRSGQGQRTFLEGGATLRGEGSGLFAVSGDLVSSALHTSVPLECSW